MHTEPAADPSYRAACGLVVCAGRLMRLAQGDPAAGPVRQAAGSLAAAAGRLLAGSHFGPAGAGRRHPEVGVNAAAPDPDEAWRAGARGLVAATMECLAAVEPARALNPEAAAVLTRALALLDELAGTLRRPERAVTPPPAPAPAEAEAEAEPPIVETPVDLTRHERRRPWWRPADPAILAGPGRR
ncbi:MAG TPA: hypothetical protein VNG13_13290 [Mycobacteriales bacterium]|nr:hypothetical protein [Mycobacteriales bacterium]